MVSKEESKSGKESRVHEKNKGDKHRTVAKSSHDQLSNWFRQSKKTQEHTHRYPKGRLDTPILLMTGVTQPNDPRLRAPHTRTRLSLGTQFSSES